MNTKMLYFPNSKLPDLEVEVTQNGDIVSAFAFIPAFDKWTDALEDLRNRPGWIDKIRDEAAALDWNDRGDEGFEDYLSQVKESLRPQ